ncbi:class I SAM-dependent methyltransferase [Patescibacteria group bacterium]|nr:class I SAM-dependent methyltransferase [Patescibacteria group bacterium]
MWDIPIEREIQKNIAIQAFGDVLVAGYGLGIVQEYLIKNPKVKSLLTIEKLKEVVVLAEKNYGRIYGNIEIGDFFTYSPKRQFDCVIGDIWEEITSECLKDYKEFESKAKNLLKPNGRIFAWGSRFF